MLALRVREADGGEQSPWLHCWLEYGSRPAISLEKIRYELFKGGVFFHPTYSGYCKENVHPFEPLDFPAELTQHVSNIQNIANLKAFFHVILPLGQPPPRRP